MSPFTSFMRRMLPRGIERQVRDIRDFYFRRYRQIELSDEIYSQNLSYYKISFCTTCMNRLFHLKHTIERNIKNNLSYPDIEFVLINYNSSDGLDEWVRLNLMKYIDQGILNYYRTDEPEFFHASKAKNLAHFLSSGDIVCNLDGDNFTGKDYAFYINYLFNKHGLDLLAHFKKSPYWGTEGRIVVTKENFLKLGGYDEYLLPIGHEDHDLINRAKAFGLQYINIQIENFLHYLSNTTKEKAENCGDKEYYDLESANRIKSNENIANSLLVANKHGFEKFNLVKNFQVPVEFP